MRNVLSIVFLCFFTFIICDSISYAGVESKSSKPWVFFGPELMLSESEFFEEISNQNNCQNCEYLETKRTSDDLGFTHTKYKIKKNGFEIHGFEITVHSKDQIVKSAQISPRLNFNTQKLNIDSSKAIQLTYNYYSRAFKIQSLKYNSIKWVMHENNSNHLIQAHEVKIQGINPLNNRLAFINIENGNLIMEFELSASCNSKTAMTILPLNSGVQNFNVQKEDNTYRLVDECRSSYSESIRTMTGFGANPVALIEDPQNQWNSGIHPYAAQCHWGTSRFYDLLQNEFGRNGFDDLGSEMISALDSTQTNGAGMIYSGLYAVHGRESNSQNKYWVSLDIVGHEWTHAIIFLESILLWNYEGRGIAEGICDVFGTFNEIQTENKFDSIKSGDWLIAEDQNNGPIRDLINPSSLGYSDTYKSALYNSASNKYQRSSPFSYWFYLLTEGGSGINNHDSSSYAYNVKGIGMTKSIKILYRSMLYYLQPQSNYKDTRYATQQSAIDLYGHCSNEFKSVLEAWNAIGVYDDSLYCQSVQAIDEQNSLEIEIYPVPSPNKLYFKNYSLTQTDYYQIYNLNGILIKTGRLKESSNEIDISELNPGVYHISLYSKYGLNHQKFIKSSD